jgi:hypothetical protein
METISRIIEESVSGGFWKFLGYFLMVALFLKVTVQLIIFLINRPLRHWTIRKHGYPPEHCDADGDFNEKLYEEEKE